jgi:hypothetical protein
MLFGSEGTVCFKKYEQQIAKQKSSWPLVLTQLKKHEQSSSHHHQ